ncbi:MAG: zinc-ribbon domain-containing protein [Clostridiales bacterium]|nr:zinc-ribbon domain-containing protein [Clostridiales bacterium]
MSRIAQMGKNDLKTWCVQNGRTDLLLEWDYEKNANLTPDKVSSGSDRAVWWKCSNGHEWSSKINNRTKKGCPYCSGRRAVKGENDLMTLNPALAEEWCYEKNGSLTPDQVKVGSEKEVWWRCSKGHEWKARIYSRAKGSGCPFCSNTKVLAGFNDLGTTKPELLKEWDYLKNGDLTPKKVTAWSLKKVWWKCAIGHEWQSVVSSRSRGLGCPYCSGQRVWVGYNDLATVKPDIAKEWNYEKNGRLTPKDVSISSGRKVWWKCTKGHEWQAIIANRSKGSGCRICQNEIQTSFPEQAIFYYIQQVFPDAENRNTEVLDGRELDIFIPSKHIGIEFDGSTWHKNIARDETKNDMCAEKGIVLYRVRDAASPKLKPNPMVYEIVFDSYRNDSLEMAINLLLLKLNQSLDVSIERDRSSILELFRTKKKESSVEESFLKLEWNTEKNGLLTPDLFDLHSGETVWWKCSKGHEWTASIYNRTRGKKCPYCSGRNTIIGVNDLETCRPDLAKEWNYEKNSQLQPSQVKVSSGKTVWWKCSVCGHEWKTRIANRSSGYGCPECGKEKTRASKIKPVMNIDTGESFKDASEAAAFYCLKSPNQIRTCCRGQQKTAGGYHWKYLD